MKISEILASKAGTEPVFSFEFFPPKTPKGEEGLFKAIRELASLKPDFVSVTYGAGGSTRAKTVEWTERILREYSIEAMAHLTCVGAARAEIGEVLDELAARKIRNVLALRGDPPKGESSFVMPENGFGHADELVDFLRERRGKEIAIGVAGYPEKHPEAPDMETDVRNLLNKIAAGADFVVTQLFFDPALYFRFLGKLRAANGGQEPGIPVIPGVMPITAKEQISKFAAMCGASTPPELREQIEAAQNEEEILEIGVAFAIRQVKELLAGGAPGIHFYTLNKSRASLRVLTEVRKAL